MNKFTRGLLFLVLVLLIGLVGSGIFAQDPIPTIDSPQLTITQIIIDATANVADHVGPPITNSGDGSGPMGTLPPFLVAGQLADNATQFAIEQTANPTLGATIEACTVPAVLNRNNAEKQAELEAIFSDAQLPVQFLILEELRSNDCIEFELSERTVLLVIDQADERVVNLSYTINASIDLLLAQGIEITRISLGIGSDLDEDIAMPFMLSLAINASYADLLRNYQEGLRGFNLFLPHSS